jgi:hypothetical protein
MRNANPDEALKHSTSDNSTYRKCAPFLRRRDEQKAQTYDMWILRSVHSVLCLEPVTRNWDPPPRSKRIQRKALLDALNSRSGLKANGAARAIIQSPDPALLCRESFGRSCMARDSTTALKPRMQSEVCEAPRGETAPPHWKRLLRTGKRKPISGHSLRRRLQIGIAPRLTTWFFGT